MIPASRIVSVEQVKYLKARSRPSLSKEMWVSKGSLTAAHMSSVMLRVPAILKSLSDNRHIYLQRRKFFTLYSHSNGECIWLQCMFWYYSTNPHENVIFCDFIFFKPMPLKQQKHAYWCYYIMSMCGEFFLKVVFFIFFISLQDWGHKNPHNYELCPLTRFRRFLFQLEKLLI